MRRRAPAPCGTLLSSDVLLLERRTIHDWNRTIDVNLEGVPCGSATALPQEL